jgi:hypothetical protein
MFALYVLQYWHSITVSILLMSLYANEHGCYDTLFAEFIKSIQS